MLQEQRREIHPHKASIIDIIEAIKKKQKEGHEVLIALDGNEKFIQDKGEITRLCHECKLHDPFTHSTAKNVKQTRKSEDHTEYITISAHITF